MTAYSPNGRGGESPVGCGGRPRMAEGRPRGLPLPGDAVEVVHGHAQDIERGAKRYGSDKGADGCRTSVELPIALLLAEPGEHNRERGGDDRGAERPLTVILSEAKESFSFLCKIFACQGFKGQIMKKDRIIKMLAIGLLGLLGFSSCSPRLRPRRTSSPCAPWAP